MARQTRVDGDAGRLQVANLTDHDNIGSLPQHRAKCRRKRHPDARVDRHLVDSADLVLHRIFDRDDLAIRLVHVVERAVESGRLARTGRTRDQDDSVWHADQPLELDLVVGKEAEIGKSQRERGLVQDAHDDALAMNGRDARDAKVEGFFAELDLDAAVLRDALFRNAHRAGHDLETAGDGGVKLFRRAGHLLEHAIDAKAHPEFLLERLEVNVAGAMVVGVEEKQSRPS